MDTLDEELALRAVLLDSGDLIVYYDIHNQVHFIARDPIDVDKEYNNVIVLTYKDLGIKVTEEK